jgi:hypothetical protein
MSSPSTELLSKEQFLSVRKAMIVIMKNLDGMPLAADIKVKDNWIIHTRMNDSGNLFLILTWSEKMKAEITFYRWAGDQEPKYFWLNRIGLEFEETMTGLNALASFLLEKPVDEKPIEEKLIVEKSIEEKNTGKGGIQKKIAEKKPIEDEKKELIRIGKVLSRWKVMEKSMKDHVLGNFSATVTTDPDTFAKGAPPSHCVEIYFGETGGGKTGTPRDVTISSDCKGRVIISALGTPSLPLTEITDEILKTALVATPFMKRPGPSS